MTMILELQTAMYDALSNDATLSGMVTGVHDFVPQGAAFPYICFGAVKAKDWSTLATNGIEATLELEVYSRKRGRKECHEILDRIRELLHEAELTVSGHTLVELFFTESEVVQERDGLTFKGSITFMARVQE